MAIISGDDTNNKNLVGTSGRDDIFGRGGHDTLRGNGGNDSIDGGSGTDTAVYSGLLSDYAISTRSGVTTIRDKRKGSPDGTDTLTNVERIQFANGSIYFLVPNASPAAVADTRSVNEDGVYNSIASLLSNDSDADGDELELIEVNGVGLVGGTATITLGSGALLTVTNTGNYTFNTNGTYDHLAQGDTATEVITYQVADQFGGISTATFTITINGTNDAPVVTAAVAGNATEDGVGVTLNGLANASDVDDGTVLSVVPPETLPDGVSFDAASNSFTLDPTHPVFQNLADGEIRVVAVNYGVTDGIATTAASMSWTVTGTNDGPVATTDTGNALEAGVFAGSNASGNVLANDSDVDAGTTLQVSGISFGSTAGLVGSPLQGAYGRLTVQADGSYLYVVNNSNAAVQALASASDTLVETFTYELSDDDGGTATATLTVTIAGQNDAPFINADTNTAVEAGVAAGSNAVGNVLANDTDFDAGDSLEVYAIEAVHAGATFFRVGDAYQSLYGTFTINADGSYTYVVDNEDPAVQALQPGQTLTERFFYNARDEAGWARAAFLTITVAGQNDAPAVSSNFLGLGLTEGAGVVSVDMLTNAFDVDNGAVLSVQNVTDLTQGITWSGTQLHFDTSDPAFDYLSQNQVVSLTVNYEIVDEHGASIPRFYFFNLSGRNDAPVAADDAGSTGEDSMLSVAASGVLANDSDVDAGDGRSVSAVQGSAANVGAQITLASGALVTMLADGSYSYDPNGQFDYLAVGQSTSDSFAYEVSDGNGGTDTATVTITINGMNDAPTAPTDIDGAPGATAAENLAVGSVVGINADSTDAEGDAVRYALVDSAGNAVQTWGHFTIDPLMGLVRLASALDYETAANHQLTIRATDASGAYSDQTFDVAVTDIQSGAVDSKIFVDNWSGSSNALLTSVFDGAAPSPLTYQILSVNGNPGSISNLNPATGQYIYWLQDWTSFSYTVTAGGITSAPATVTLVRGADTRFIGTSGNDEFYVDKFEYVDAGGGNDDIIVAHGESTLIGGAGNDTLTAYWGHGNLFDGGPGADTIWLPTHLSPGNSHAADTVLLRPGEVQGDSISGFENGEGLDVLQFTGFGDGAYLSYAGGNSWQVHYGDGQVETFTLSGVTSLSPGDYIFGG